MYPSEFNVEKSYIWRRIAAIDTDPFLDLVQVYGLDGEICKFSFQTSPNISMSECRRMVESHYGAYVAGQISAYVVPGSVPEVLYPEEG